MTESFESKPKPKTAAEVNRAGARAFHGWAGLWVAPQHKLNRIIEQLRTKQKV